MSASRSLATTFVVSILVGAIAGAFAGSASVDARLRQIDYDLSGVATRNMVNFTITSVQPIGYGNFALARAEQEPHLTGLRFKGRIINMTSVVFENLKFEIRIGGKTADIYISRVSPGDSTSFEAYMPDIKPEDAELGELRFIESSIRYQAT